jgi:hypothetical protein
MTKRWRKPVVSSTTKPRPSLTPELQEDSEPLPGQREDEAETFQDLLEPLDGAASVSARCLFVDPIADIAVLDSPDDQMRTSEPSHTKPWSIR